MNKNNPNLFVIGASKCGTTSLWHMLNSHTNVFMSKPKEPWFFSFSDYKKKMEWYHGLFKDVKDEKIIGEASPIYSETTLIPEIPKRLYDYNPNAKIIYIVREPISRLKSVWQQTLSSGHWYKQKYKDYTDVEVPKMSRKFTNAVFSYPAFLEATKYWTHLNNYRNYFDDKNILLLFFEDLRDKPEIVYEQLCNFLEIEPKQSKNLFEKQNASEGKTKEFALVVKLRNNKTIYNVFNRLKKYGLKISFPKKSMNSKVKINKEQKEKISNLLEIEIEKTLKYGKKSLGFWK